MIRVILYDIKNRKNSLFLLISALFWLFCAWLFMTLFPQPVGKIAETLNQYEWLRAFFGTDRKIEFVMYEQIMTLAFVPYILFFLYRTIVDVANALQIEKREGTLLYFLSLPFNKIQLFTMKFIISFIILVLQVLVLWIMMRFLSLYHAPDHEYYYTTITEHVAKRMLYFGSAAFLALGIGTLCGSLASLKKTKTLTSNIMLLGSLFCFLPNLFDSIRIILNERNIELMDISKLLYILEKIRLYFPVYWSSSVVSTTLFQYTEIVLPYIVMSVVMIVVGGRIYVRR